MQDEAGDYILVVKYQEDCYYVQLSLPDVLPQAMRSASIVAQGRKDIFIGMDLIADLWQSIFYDPVG